MGPRYNFTGGQDAYDGPVVQQSDIDGEVKSLISANQPDPQQILQPQIHPSEQFAGTPQCTLKQNADHKAGDRVATVTITVSFLCSGEVYDHRAAVALASEILMQAAAADPGSGYVLVGKINIVVMHATVDAHNMASLLMSAEGVWAYQFTNTQKQTLAQLIVGKSTQEAQQALDSRPGVDKAIAQLSGIGQTLPSDPAKITIVVQWE